ncbi:MAG: hypothetical protein GY737_19675 [Desulfobacteraceae bacterium]|nr:hypothetical protein [Desulfobacteraceae bacterium]
MGVTGEVADVKQEVLNKLKSISERLKKDVKIVSGKRDGDIDKSPHNTGIAADIKISGLKTVALCDELEKEGFTGIGEYYTANEEEYEFAHGDIRGLPGAEESGAYAEGGDKSSVVSWWRTGSPTGGVYHFGSRKGES